MSNVQHTAEPWKINGSRVEGQDGALVAGVFDGSLSDCEDHAAREANARRIVACVNACEGFETEGLERHGIDGVMFGTKEWLLRLEQQRDALLAALEQCAASMEGDKLYVNTLAYAQRAIAAAKGGAV